MARKPKPVELTEEERHEHAVAQEVYAFDCGKNDARDNIARKFHDDHLQAIYEEARHASA